ncbi:MAG: FAD-dependent oxidoreductase, partial [Muribaculaceae bacterium]|nr:FAD-dependent oxidoreductase [Muribaculaceae bacterium]
MTTKQHIVIIGGGFAGLNIAKNIDYNIYDVTVVDAHNYNSFPPLFYQVASSGLEPASISFPFRKELRHKALKGCKFHWGRVS